MAPWTKPESSPASNGQPSRATDERTPLLQVDEPTTPLPITQQDADAIPPNDFDILLSRSLPTSGPFLEPESTVNPLLRGPRRYSTASKNRRPSLASRSDRDAVADSAAADSDDDRDRDSDDAVSVSSAASTPYLNGISRSRFWFIFAEILLTYFIACFDGTIMASSHPVITSYFHASHSASWLSTAFLLTSSAFQPLLGRLSDSIGRKPPYVATMVIFTFATMWCALAQSMTSFIFARALCGLGAGGMMTLGSIIVSDLVPIENRGAYQSYINMIYGVGSALGAALGGAMADHLGWRWEFGVQVPPLILCCVIAVIAVPSDLGLVGKRETFVQALKAFDFKGSILLTTSITFFVLGLNLGGNILPWSHPVVIASLVIFGVCFPVFLYVQSYVARPIMPLYLVRRSPRMNIIFSNFFAALLSNAILFNIPLFFQAVLLTTATSSGLRLVIPSLVSSAVGTATGFLITYTRRLKWPVLTGAVALLIGTVALSSMRRGWASWVYLLCLVPSSIGQGFQFPGSFMAILVASEQREQAVVTSTLILWRSLGMVLGVASSSLVVQNALVGYLNEYVQGPDKDEVIRKVRESVESIVKLPELYREQVVMSYEAALRTTFLCCTVIAFLSVCLLVPIKLPRLGSRK
ncbi:Major facilitator superfamily transporter [Colletotrichum higginsianum IMI 349063]|uniref:Major facilitator superfamily transporter n=4 Tax=Colletotrichum higginsianum TaxID=80884 RepID=A0A1B7YKT5_COLHI|nr:Major facilitator superfamily transporter [Colletotrichum higginsianum IMI 349063]OBR12572.1 Major facilitator superfamily transporter [Colletotrichum higginsianum IMI 349063]TIC99377.1 putative transporter [Colletotrichum higginsianum]